MSSFFFLLAVNDSALLHRLIREFLIRRGCRRLRRAGLLFAFARPRCRVVLAFEAGTATAGLKQPQGSATTVATWSLAADNGIYCIV